MRYLLADTGVAEKMSVLLTAAYIAFILYETLMFREAGDARTNFVLFSYADRFLTEQSVRVGSSTISGFSCLWEQVGTG